MSDAPSQTADRTPSDALSEADHRTIPWITAVYNQKGGVGKTTTAANLATALAACGQTVILVDLDSQGNATTSVGGLYNQGPGAYEFFTGDASLAELARETAYPGLRLVAASRMLAGLELELSEQDSPQFVFRERLLSDMPSVDHILIDSPPALGLLPVNALVAAHSVLVPVQSETFAHDGMVNAFFSLKRIRSTFNPSLAIHGVLVTMMGTDATSKKLDKVIRSEFADAVFSAVIPRDIAVSDSADADHPVVVHAPQSPGAQAYMEATREFLHREADLRERLSRQRASTASGPTSEEGGRSLPLPCPLSKATADPDASALAATTTLARWHARVFGGIPTGEETANNSAPDAPKSKPVPPPLKPTLEAPADDIPPDWTGVVDDVYAPTDGDQGLRTATWVMAAAAVVVLCGVIYITMTTMG
ncbi:MAG: ParA family protein [Rhodospirillum sp.]|nr:ParA family protein [Rhodospirillum sp.]MCF8488436.1 ParA family protein [Rhodospirillum sp.]MCF8499098.1 ParA family protein [Rhodospirillum sp.]